MLKMRDEARDSLEKKYPSNNKLVKKEVEETKEKKMKKITTGGVRTQKKSLGSKMTETFLDDSIANAKDHVVHSVLIPALKSLVCDIVGWNGIAEQILFGDGGSGKRGGGSRSKSRYGHTNYNTISSQKNRREVSRTNRARHNFEEVIFDARGDADEVLEHLRDAIDQYEFVSVGDFYDLAGVRSSFADDKYGWTDLRRTNVIRTRGNERGYIINFPRPEPID